MILIALAGNSTRFFNEGYQIVKYKLELGNKNVIESILSYIPRTEKVLIVLNRKYQDYIFFVDLLSNLEFDQFKIVEIGDTKGQFVSVLLGLEASRDFWNENEPVTIYNGDTVRKITDWQFIECDGYIEVFEAEGSHWSFVDNLGRVKLVTEKNRISPYCSSGLYYFKEIRFLLQNASTYMYNAGGEFFIAPFYNVLIEKGFNIQSGLVSKELFLFCGTPSEYQQTKKNL